MNVQEWHTVTIVDNKPEAIGLNRLTIKTNPVITTSYINSGQYVQMRADSSQARPGFFAIASGTNDKDDDVMTFLIKETDSSQYLIKSQPGSKVE